jgi:hypothetical protein
MKITIIVLALLTVLGQSQFAAACPAGRAQCSGNCC